MIGYKATTNGKCLDQLYEVSQTYTLEGKIEICKKGFHFCQDLFDIFNYYPPNKNTKVFKVEALGNIETDGDKSVTDKIKILEEVNLNNMILEKYGYKKYFDDKSNLIKAEGSYGYWEKHEYDENNNRIKEEYCSGYWKKFEYDESSNLIKREECNGYWVKYKYDESNNLIKLETSDGSWEKIEYDENNNITKKEYGRG